MSDLGDVLTLWRKAEEDRDPFVLATIVAVEGSSYRRPGARMIVTANGERAGTISGGCLEAEVARKAAWLVKQGPVVAAFKTNFDLDDEVPSGSGCGGTIHTLLEPYPSANALLRQLDWAWRRRTGLGIATVIGGPGTGRRQIASGTEDSPAAHTHLSGLAESALRKRASTICSAPDGEIFLEYVPPRRAIYIFGAGDDALPLVTYASALGWYVVVVDGRSNLARQERFPKADQVRVLSNIFAAELDIRHQDAVVLMTHSYEQDLRALRIVLPIRPTYLGMLGPRIRSEHLVRRVTNELKLDFEATMSEIHAPLGIDIGRDHAAVIALAGIAEIQEAFYQDHPAAHDGTMNPSRMRVLIEPVENSLK
jgi:xanthine/CO dehydrogenase XdhC/CoxF family maturation factor